MLALEPVGLDCVSNRRGRKRVKRRNELDAVTRESGAHSVSGQRSLGSIDEYQTSFSIPEEKMSVGPSILLQPTGQSVRLCQSIRRTRFLSCLSSATSSEDTPLIIDVMC